MNDRAKQKAHKAYIKFTLLSAYDNSGYFGPFAEYLEFVANTNDCHNGHIAKELIAFYEDE